MVRNDHAVALVEALVRRSMSSRASRCRAHVERAMEPGPRYPGGLNATHVAEEVLFENEEPSKLIFPVVSRMG